MRVEINTEHRKARGLAIFRSKENEEHFLLHVHVILSDEEKHIVKRHKLSALKIMRLGSYGDGDDWNLYLSDIIGKRPHAIRCENGAQAISLTSELKNEALPLLKAYIDKAKGGTSETFEL